MPKHAALPSPVIATPGCLLTLWPDGFDLHRAPYHAPPRREGFRLDFVGGITRRIHIGLLDRKLVAGAGFEPATSWL